MHDNAAPPSGGTERVLVVVQSKTVGLFVRGLLERWGFAVLPADGANTALAILADGRIDTAVIDAAIPGAEIVARTAAASTVPVLAICSGGLTLEGAASEVSPPIEAAAFRSAVLACRARIEREPPPAAGIDTNAVAALWGTTGNPGFHRVAKVFIRELETFVAHIPGLLAPEDRDALERHAHSIKGAASNVGAGALAAIALQLENEAKSGQDDRLRGLIAAIETEAWAAISGLRALMPVKPG